MTAADIISTRRDAWDIAHAELSEHMRAHRECRAWHPLGSQARMSADVRSRRLYRRLCDAERGARETLTSALRFRGYVPLPSGLYQRLSCGWI